MRTASPAVVRSGLAETAASPSRRCATASNGAVCSLKPWPSSKANSVTVPVARLTSDRLTSDPSWYFEVDQADDFRHGHFTLTLRLLRAHIWSASPPASRVVNLLLSVQAPLSQCNFSSPVADVLSLRGVPRLFEAPGLVPDPPGWSKREAGIPTGAARDLIATISVPLPHSVGMQKSPGDYAFRQPGIPRGASVVRVRSF